MDYRDFLDLTTGIPETPDGSEGPLSLNNSITEEEIGKFRVLPARKHVNFNAKENLNLKDKHVCFISEHLLNRLSVSSDAYYIITTNVQLNQNKIKGMTPNHGDLEYLVKIKGTSIDGDIGKLTDVIFLPDLLLFDLGIEKNSIISLKKSSLYIDDNVIENIDPKGNYSIKIAKRIVFYLVKNRFTLFATPEIVYNLLIDCKISLVHNSQTLVLNFYHMINEEFYKKIPPFAKSRFMKLMALKKTLPQELFYFIVQVKDIELSEKDLATELNYPNIFIFQKKTSTIAFNERSMNSFLPIRKLAFSKIIVPEFLRGLYLTPYFNKNVQLLGNITQKLMAGSGLAKSNCNIVALSYPKGFGLSSWLKYIASNNGLNFYEKKVKECFSTTQIEKSVYKAIGLRPSILLIKGISKLQNILNLKASINKSNSINAYVSKLYSLVSQAVINATDSFPILIFIADSAKEKIGPLFNETHDSFDYFYNIEAPELQDHSEIMKLLLTWFSVTTEDLETISNVSKGLGWKKIFSVINSSEEMKNPQLLKKRLEQLRKESSTITAVNVPDVTWKDIGGLMEAKNEIIDTIMLPQMYPELFKNKIKPRTGLLFFGPPGTGKTLLAKAIANECKMNFISVKGPELLNMYIGESEKNVRDLFNRARANLPCIIFFDELDALVPARGNGSDSNSVMDRIVAQFLTEIDGIGKENGLFVIGATNRPDLLDKSLLRPGRFDKMIYLGINSDKESRVKILQAQTRKFNLTSDVDFDKLEDKIPKNFTGADFYALTSGAILKSVHRKIAGIEEQFKELKLNPSFLKTFEEWTLEFSEDDKKMEVNMKDFLEALSEITPSVSEKELEKYKELKAKYSVN